MGQVVSNPLDNWDKLATYIQATLPSGDADRVRAEVDGRTYRSSMFRAFAERMHYWDG